MPDLTAGRLPGPAWAIAIATVCGCGRLHPGPGTWGSFASAVLALPVLYGAGPWCGMVLALMALMACVAGLVAVQAVQAAGPVQDPPQVVIDEVLGVWLALACIPSSVLVACPLLALTLTVLFFRLLDIAKPFPISACERLPGAVGVMADDALAGLIAGLTTLAVLG